MTPDQCYEPGKTMWLVLRFPDGTQKITATDTEQKARAIARGLTATNSGMRVWVAKTVMSVVGESSLVETFDG